MTHIDSRVHGRLARHNIKVSQGVLNGIAEHFENAAIILRKMEHKGINEGDYKTRAESNGDLLVLIVRDHKPITIMFRRSTQTNTPEQLRVKQLVDLS